jgi:hypothetical protein
VMDGITVSVISSLPGLPYSKAYAAWKAHVPDCGPCAEGMAAATLCGLDRTPELLCPVGCPLDTALRYAIDAQHYDSRLN